MDYSKIQEKMFMQASGNNILPDIKVPFDACMGAAGGNYVTFYVDDNYSGRANNLPIGEYPKSSDLAQYGIANDDVSSVKVPAGIKLIMYKDDDFKGKSVETASDIPSLRAKGFNDDMSSAKVMRYKTDEKPENGAGNGTEQGGISTFGWIMIIGGSIAVIGLSIFAVFKLTK